MPFYNSFPLFGKYLKSGGLLEPQTLAELAKRAERFRSYIGLGEEVSFASTAMSNFDSKRMTAFTNALEQSKGLDGLCLRDVINDGKTKESQVQAAKRIKNGLLEFLKPEDNYTSALQKYTEDSSTFKELIKRIPNGGYGAEDVLGVMKTIIDDAHKAIVDQHDQDKLKIEQLFEDDKFKNDLRSALNIEQHDADADAKIAAMKSAMLKDLKTSQDAQLADFDKETSENLTKLHQASSKQYKQMGLIDLLYEIDVKNALEIEKIAREKRQAMQNQIPPPNSSINITATENQAKIAEATLLDLKEFKSLTGLTIKQIEPGHFVVELPTISPFYYQSINQKPLADVSLIAQAVKAEGYDTITWNTTISDQETAYKRLRQCVDASVRAGFDMDKIIIKDQAGKEIKFEELFKDDTQTLSNLKKKAAEIKQEIANIDAPKTTRDNFDKVKEGIASIKQEQEEEKKKALSSSRSSPSLPSDSRLSGSNGL